MSSTSAPGTGCGSISLTIWGARSPAAPRRNRPGSRPWTRLRPAQSTDRRITSCEKAENCFSWVGTVACRRAWSALVDGWLVACARLELERASWRLAPPSSLRPRRGGGLTVRRQPHGCVGQGREKGGQLRPPLTRSQRYRVPSASTSRRVLYRPRWRSEIASSYDRADGYRTPVSGLVMPHQ